MKIKSICVFCGASDKADQVYKDLATKCGAMIAERKLDLVYGGSKTGLMGCVAQGAVSGDGRVSGIFPKLLSKFEPLSAKLDNVILVDSMSRRKDLMIEKSDAFFVLPGGFGTLDEFFEVVTLKVLEQHDKPIILINYLGFWDLLIKLCNQILEMHFAKDRARESYILVNDLEEAFKVLGL